MINRISFSSLASQDFRKLCKQIKKYIYIVHQQILNVRLYCFVGLVSSKHYQILR